MTRIARKSALVPIAAALLWIGSAPDMGAQATTSASITGIVTDESGAPMPDVQISVTSPVLQVSQVTGATDSQGNYRVLNLPAPGVYKATFSRAGFQTFVRDGLNLS